MTGKEFLRKVRKVAKREKLFFGWHPNLGKGSHGVIRLGTQKSVLRNTKDELKTGTLNAMLKQLGLSEEDIR